MPRPVSLQFDLPRPFWPGRKSNSAHDPRARWLPSTTVTAMHGPKKTTADAKANAARPSNADRELSPVSPSSEKRSGMPHAALASRTNGATPIAQSFLDQSSVTRSNTAASLHPSEKSMNGETLGSTDTSHESLAVGGASLGKSGRVIERLMHENDMLKRDLQIERLRSEEARKDVSMAQGKVAQMQSEYDAQVHEATVTKTLLKRRERQLADARAQIDGERQRADAALDRERTWRSAMETTEKESKELVERATSQAQLMEGRNNVLSSHWKKQGDMVDASVKKLGAEITAISSQRQQDIERMNSLQDICDQQSIMLQKLGGEKEAIAAAFDAYKHAQDDLLRNIKLTAADHEHKHARMTAEAQKVLGDLKWALNVKNNVKGAGEE